MIIDKTWDMAYFDLFVDGVWIKSEGHEPVNSGNYETFFTLPEHNGKRNITIYLPYCVELELHKLEFSPGAVVEVAEPRPKKLLCLGDSITQGSYAKYPSNTYPVLLSNFLNMQLLNQGVGGYIYNADSLDLGLPYQPDLITVAYGTNDWSKCSSISQFRSNCANYMHKLVSMFPEARIYVMTPIWRPDKQDLKKTGALHDISRVITEECSTYSNLRVIDGLSLVPHLLYLFDGVHPKDEGFLHMAMNLVKIIGPELH